MYEMNEMAELIEAFRSESEEILDRVEELLLRLEQSPDDDELLNEIFRGAHTIKGGAACLQFDDLTAFAHVVEEVLENLRNGAAQPTGPCISRLLEAVDAMRDLAARAISGNGALTPHQRALMQVLNTSETSPSFATPATVQRTAHSLRVGIDKLDRMLDLTGEIAIARGHLRQLAASDERLLDAVREVDRLSFNLQELVMSARMVALEPALRPFQRVVRDVAASRQKRVSLVIEAGDVEVDSTVIEQLRDPITHMLRNAIDHGIERDGTIRIHASHDRSGITIRLSDDGRGLDEQRIAQRARELGLEPSLDLIFRPGFSTATTVTEVSGRGVGMDVVRKNVEALRGTISIASERGAGTTITIRLPLSVTVIEGFAVAASGETYVLPIDVVSECMALPDTAGGDAFGVLNLRGEVLPFLRLRELFGLGASANVWEMTTPHPPFGHLLPSRGEKALDSSSLSPRQLHRRGERVAEGRVRGDLAISVIRSGVEGSGRAARQAGSSFPTRRSRENVVIVQHEHGRAGIVVDELLGANDTVMKPLSGLLRQVAGVAGSSILGNGRVALVLDAREIVRCAIQSQSAG